MINWIPLDNTHRDETSKKGGAAAEGSHERNRQLNVKGAKRPGVLPHVIQSTRTERSIIQTQRDHTSNNCGIDWLERYSFASSIDILNVQQLNNSYATPSITTSKYYYYCHRYYDNFHHAHVTQSRAPVADVKISNGLTVLHFLPRDSSQSQRLLLWLYGKVVRPSVYWSVRDVEVSWSHR